MSVCQRIRIVLFCCCLLAVSVGLSLSAQPFIVFDPQSIRITGLTPGSSAVYLAAARIAHGYSRDIATESGTVSDPDHDGIADIPLHRRLPLHSLWIAVDLATGRSAVEFPHPPGAFHRSEKLNMGELRELARDGFYVMFLVVRPSVGAWTLTVEDSDRHDADNLTDRKVKLRIRDMEPVGGSPAPPQHLQKGDVVFAVDPIDLRVFELRDDEAAH
jgi:hypothetical protein